MIYRSAAERGTALAGEVHRDAAVFALAVLAVHPFLLVATFVGGHALIIACRGKSAWPAGLAPVSLWLPLAIRVSRARTT